MKLKLSEYRNKSINKSALWSQPSIPWKKNEDVDGRTASLTVVMLPWLAHGHLFPFLELAKRLAHANVLVHFCSTPINLSFIREELNHKAFPLIKLVDIRLPIDLLPPHLHTTKFLPPRLMPELKAAFDRAEPGFRGTLVSLRPDVLVYDFVQPWAPRVACELGVPAVLFLTTAASASAYFCHHLRSPGRELPFDAPDEEHVRATMVRRTANGVSDGDRFLQCVDLSTVFIASRTFREIESDRIDYLSSLVNKEVVPVGPLIPDTFDEIHESSRKVLAWLDGRDESSVVFASFGSEYFMSEEETEEIAMGLELSGVSFVWVLRFPKGGEEEEEKETVTQGARQAASCSTMERVAGDAGLVLTGWAPHREILMHASTGGFLSHCGWSSVMEGMRFGVPIVALPMQLNQPMNAKLVVELGMGVEVRRGDRGRMFRKEDVAEGIRYAVVNEEGQRLRIKAKKMAEMMGRKGNEEIATLVRRMSSLRTRAIEQQLERNLEL